MDDDGNFKSNHNRNTQHDCWNRLKSLVVKKDNTINFAIARDLRRTILAVEEEITTFKEMKTSDVEIGKRLLFLFQCDLLPGIQGKILESKDKRQVHRSKQVRRTLKLFGWGFLLLLNGGMLFYILLFAIAQTSHRQSAWFQSFMIWLVMEIVLVSTNAVFVTHVLIPTFTMTEVNKVKEKLVTTIRQFQTELNMKMKHDQFDLTPLDNDTESGIATAFNTAKYMFVSYRVAKLYPHLRESQLILRFHSPYPKQSYLHQYDSSKSYNASTTALKKMVAIIAVQIITQLLIVPPGIQDAITDIAGAAAAGYVFLVHIQLWQIAPALAFIPALIIGVVVHFSVRAENARRTIKHINDVHEKEMLEAEMLKRSQSKLSEAASSQETVEEVAAAEAAAAPNLVPVRPISVTLSEKLRAGKWKGGASKLGDVVLLMKLKKEVGDVNSGGFAFSDDGDDGAGGGEDRPDEMAVEEPSMNSRVPLPEQPPSETGEGLTEDEKKDEESSVAAAADSRVTREAAEMPVRSPPTSSPQSQAADIAKKAPPPPDPDSSILNRLQFRRFNAQDAPNLYAELRNSTQLVAPLKPLFTDPVAMTVVGTAEVRATASSKFAHLYEPSHNQSMVMSGGEEEEDEEAKGLGFEDEQVEITMPASVYARSNSVRAFDSTKDVPAGVLHSNKLMTEPQERDLTMDDYVSPNRSAYSLREAFQYQELKKKSAGTLAPLFGAGATNSSAGAGAGAGAAGMATAGSRGLHATRSKYALSGQNVQQQEQASMQESDEAYISSPEVSSKNISPNSAKVASERKQRMFGGRKRDASEEFLDLERIDAASGAVKDKKSAVGAQKGATGGAKSAAGGGGGGGDKGGKSAAGGSK